VLKAATTSASVTGRPRGARRADASPAEVPVSGEPAAEFGHDETLVLEQRFAIAPEWVIDVDVSDAAFRLYCVLLQYG
jgi:hypothetical protein